MSDRQLAGLAHVTAFCNLADIMRVTLTCKTFHAHITRQKRYWVRLPGSRLFHSRTNDDDDFKKSQSLMTPARLFRLIVEANLHWAALSKDICTEIALHNKMRKSPEEVRWVMASLSHLLNATNTDLKKAWMAPFDERNHYSHLRDSMLYSCDEVLVRRALMVATPPKDVLADVLVSAYKREKRQIIELIEKVQPLTEDLMRGYCQSFWRTIFVSFCGANAYNGLRWITCRYQFCPKWKAERHAIHCGYRMACSKGHIRILKWIGRKFGRLFKQTVYADKVWWASMRVAKWHVGFYRIGPNLVKSVITMHAPRVFKEDLAVEKPIIMWLTARFELQGFLQQTLELAVVKKSQIA